MLRSFVASRRRHTRCSGVSWQAEDGIRDAQESRGLGDVYKRQLHDLAIGELVEGHHSASDLFACRWDAHKRARVSATQRRSLCDHVSFGNHSLDREAEVRKALTEPDKAFLKSLNAVRLPLKGKEVNNVGSERVIYRLQIDSVEGVVKTSNDRFVVFK